jgi:excisionase family DNA binding protein
MEDMNKTNLAADNPMVANRQTSGRLLRVANAAKLLGVSPRTVRHWAATGILSAHRRGPKMWFFYESDLAACLSSEAHVAGIDRTSPFRVDARKYPATSATPALRLERSGHSAR